MRRFLGWVLMLWCPSVIVASLFLKSYRRPFLVFGIATGGFFIGVVAVLLGLEKVKTESKKFQLLSFLRKGFKRTPWQQYTGYEIIALGLLAFLAAVAFVGFYFL